jgi:spermidine synthase
MFQALDHQHTPLGELVLRRRASPSLGGQLVYEVTLDGEFLMSSVVNASEVALTQLGLAALGRPASRVMVAGLGLGHTAATVLDDAHVAHLDVVELLAPVLRWHREGLVPLGPRLTSDPRCHLVQDDFFTRVAAAPAGPVYDAILVDIDHSPEALLSPSHAGFYARGGLERLAVHLTPDGVLGYWSADPPPPDFLRGLEAVFGSVQVHTVEFYNPFMDEEDVNTVLVARRAG